MLKFGKTEEFQEYKSKPQEGQLSHDYGFGKLSPLTAEVQAREEMKAAQESLISAAEQDLARRQSILSQAQTAGRRQAAEGMIQATRGMEAGTGARGALGRQAAADALMQEQQLAAQRAQEMPAFDMASLRADVLAQQQALGSLSTDRQASIAAYNELLNAFPPGSDIRDSTIDSIMMELAGQEGADWWVIQWLNSQRSKPNPAFEGGEFGTAAAGGQPLGLWYYNSETGQYERNQIGPDGEIVTETSDTNPLQYT